jgi:hypothetical protein
MLEEKVSGSIDIKSKKVEDKNCLSSSHVSDTQNHPNDPNDSNNTEVDLSNKNPDEINKTKKIEREAVENPEENACCFCNLFFVFFFGFVCCRNELTMFFFLFSIILYWIKCKE